MKIRFVFSAALSENFSLKYLALAIQSLMLFPGTIFEIDLRRDKRKTTRKNTSTVHVDQDCQDTFAAPCRGLAAALLSSSMP